MISDTTKRTARILTTSCLVAMSALDAQGPSFVPGQVIARFMVGTPQRAAVAQVSRTSPIDLSGLDKVTSELSDRCGVPLRVDHLGSGYWVTFDVDRSKLANHVVEALEAQADVGTVTADYDAGGAAVERFVVVAAHGSSLERVVERNDRAALTEVLDSWSAAVGLHLESQIDGGLLVLSVDWNASTLELVDRVSALPEIEAAQANYRMGLSSRANG